MDDFDTMGLPPYITGSLRMNGTMQNSEYLAGLPLDLQQTPHAGPDENDPFVSGDDITFSQQPPITPHDAMRRFSNPQFENPFPLIMPPPTFDASPEQQQPPHHYHNQQGQPPQPPHPHPQDASIDHNHRLLSFSLPFYNFTLLDYTMRRTSLSMSAQLNGMFFLAESPWSATSPTTAEHAPPPAPTPTPHAAELTCYRRNLFQIAGNVTLPRTLRYVMTEHGDRIPIMAQELTVSATESVEGNPVKIISVPWKTPAAGNPAGQQPEDSKAEKEPPAIPLELMSGQEMDSDYANFSIAWKRLQFRIATANNGRRKELQQHFVVRLRVVATLSTGTKAIIAESQSAPVIVRGRSPRNFQSRKDLPLSGSAAASRKSTQQATAAANRANTNDAAPRSSQQQTAAGSKRSQSPTNEPDPAPQPLQLDQEQQEQQQQQQHPPPLASLSTNNLPDWTGPASATIPGYTTTAAVNGGGIPAYAQTTPEASRPPPGKRRRTNGDTGAISLSLFDDEPEVTDQKPPTSSSNNAAANSGASPIASQFPNGQIDQQQQQQQQNQQLQQHDQVNNANKFPQVSTSPSNRQPLGNAYNNNLPGSGISLVTHLSQQLSPQLTSPNIANPSDTADLLYEYFPLGLDDWQAPVDAVYRPHVVHHTHLLLDDPKSMATRSRSRRYFAGGAS